VLHGDSEGAEEDLVMVIADAGYLAMRAGRNETAVLLLSSTEETWRERLLTELWSGSVTCYNDSLENTRKALGDERFDQVWKRGKGVTLPQVIDEALRFLEEMEKEDINVGPIPGTWNETPLNPPSEEKTPSRKEEFRATPTAPYPNDLTTREVEVLRLVAQGLTDAEVGEKLFISTRTVNAHLRSIYSKLGVTTRVDASLFAKEHKLV
jgi:DNA-binding CsgD family transcriptional regulator